ncbi:hypothetical protein [Pseudomonas sp. EA_35y_Pfl2_R5]|uniref:hypothetical protein n=1 Tax=Pseudomonas sp. EA_35y_Pfl2_R5 TaxID=3088690 RepID=UPI0030DA6C11
MLSKLHDEYKADFERLDHRGQLSSIPFASISYAEKILPVHLDQSTDQATRRTATMDYLLSVFLEWGLILQGKAVLELHAGPIGVAPLVSKFGGTSYQGLEINEYLASYANQNTCSENGFTWCVEETLEYVRRQHSNGKWDVVFALYESLNTYTKEHCHELIQGLGRILKKGSCVVGDVRTDQQIHGRYELSLSRSDNQIRLEEQGDLPGKQLVARRTTTISTSGMLREEYNCLRLISVDQLDLSFAAAGFKLRMSGRPLLSVDSDVHECRGNYFFIYEKIA